MKSVSEMLTEAAQREPDLAPYYDLHRRLLERQAQARSEIAATLALVDEPALQERLRQGLPLIAFEQLPLDAGRFARLAQDIAHLLIEYDVEAADRTLPDADGWFTLARRLFELEDEGMEGATLARMAAAQALQPYLRWAAEQVTPQVDLELWKRGSCPVCGGAPDFATLDEDVGARRLSCSRCDCEWSFRRVGCPFCGITDHTKLAYFPSEDQVYRLYVCQDCRRYLKTVDLRAAGRAVLVPVERIITVGMDAAAQQEGYRLA